MSFRRVAAPAVVMLLAGACASESGGAIAAEGAAPAGSTPLTDDDASASPPSTFVPALTGPWAEGGAERESDDGVIVDPDASENLPATLGRLTWPTDWSRRTVEDWTEFLAGLGGADPRDGIPPIDTPSFETTAAAAEWLAPQEPGALVEVDGEARFYPLSILTRHEIVNDAFGDIPVAVTFCPLCNTALAFDRRIDGQVLRLGVSGLLRNSDLVMWDDATTSLWQQITGEGLVGEFAGSQLEVIPTAIVSLAQFRERFPDGRSLAAESGGGRGSYGFNPYRGYSSSEFPFLFAGEIDDRLPPLSRVVGVDIDGAARAYPFGALNEHMAINDELNGTPLVVLSGGDTTDALDQSSIADSQSIGTAIAFDPVLDGRRLTFDPGSEAGSFVDRETGSIWTVLGSAVEGELAGAQLTILPHRNEFWFAWQAFFGAENVYDG